MTGSEAVELVVRFEDQLRNARQRVRRALHVVQAADAQLVTLQKTHDEAAGAHLNKFWPMTVGEAALIDELAERIEFKGLDLTPEELVDDLENVVALLHNCVTRAQAAASVRSVPT